MSRIVDVSLPISPDLLVWPGDPPIENAPLSRIADGDPANVSIVRFGTHVGTHIDPPSHFLDGGPTLDEVPLEVLFGDAFLADARLVGLDFLSVEARDAPGHPVHVELLSSRVVIVEGLDLGSIEPGSCTAGVFPLKIAGGDGGPARAFAVID